MALSQEARRVLAIAMGDVQKAKEIADAIDAVETTSSALATAAAGVEPLEETADLVGVDGTDSNAAPLVETEARLDAIEAKLNELINALAGVSA